MAEPSSTETKVDPAPIEAPPSPAPIPEAPKAEPRHGGKHGSTEALRQVRQTMAPVTDRLRAAQPEIKAAHNSFFAAVKANKKLLLAIVVAFIVGAVMVTAGGAP